MTSRLLPLVAIFPLQAFANPDPDSAITRTTVDQVWSGHRVGFGTLVADGKQFIAYYDPDQNMKIASRDLTGGEWTYQILPSKIGWDSHNNIVLTTDRDGHLHVSGNMHVDPLVYFRTTEPGDITTLEPIHAMTGEAEDRVTYPRFLRDPAGRLVFSYRAGSSGDGVNYYNVYDEESQTWSRLLDAPLFDGQGEMNAYPLGPDLGPDGYFHMSWVWRDTIDASTNHDLHYARSKDLVTWENAFGEPIAVPINPAKKLSLVDPIPVRGGIINGSGDIGFDQNDQILIAYHKFDANGKTQLYFARPEANGPGWYIKQASDWNHRWEIEGGGSLNTEISHSGVRSENGNLVINVRQPEIKNGVWRIDPDTLQLDRRLPVDPGSRRIAKAVGPVRSDFPGMQTQTAKFEPPPGLNRADVIRWETLPAHGDVAPPKPWPGPSDLELIEIRLD